MSSLTDKQRRGEKIQWTERARARHTAIDSPSALKSLMHRVMHDFKHGNVQWKGGRRQAIAVGLALQSRRRAKGAVERRAAAQAPRVPAAPPAGGRGNRHEAALRAWVTRRAGGGAKPPTSVKSLGKKGGPVFAPRVPASPPVRKAAGPRWASLR